MSGKIRVAIGLSGQRRSRLSSPLKSVLEGSGCVVTTINSTAEFAALINASSEADRPDVVIVEMQFSDGSPFDVLFESKNEASKSLPAIVLMTQVRRDHELLNFWRQRGVGHFVDPSEDAHSILKLVEDIHYGKRRRHRRLPIRTAAILSWRRGKVEGQTVDISLGGLMLTHRMKALGSHRPDHGERVTATISLEPVVLNPDRAHADGQHSRSTELSGIVRAVREERTFFNSRVLVAIEFVELAPDVHKAIEAFIENLAILRERQAVAEMPL